MYYNVYKSDSKFKKNAVPLDILDEDKSTTVSFQIPLGMPCIFFSEQKRKYNQRMSTLLSLYGNPDNPHLRFRSTIPRYRIKNRHCIRQ